MQRSDYLYTDVTEKIIQAFYEVYNNLGFGFLEKVYENALIVELTSMGFEVQQQVPIQVYYRDAFVGKYYCDLLIIGKIIIEVKAAESLRPEHELQLINYLKATDIELGLLLNFGQTPTFRRKIFSNKNKRA